MTTMQRWSETSYKANRDRSVVWWDHPDAKQTDFLSAKTKVLVVPPNSGSNYQPKKTDWQRIPWVQNKR